MDVYLQVFSVNWEFKYVNTKSLNAVAYTEIFHCKYSISPPVPRECP